MTNRQRPLKEGYSTKIIDSPNEFELCSLHDLFIDWARQPIWLEFRQLAMTRSKVSVIIALSEETIVGLKMGYAKGPTVFHSWIGAVDPNFRRRGIASQLMKLQHLWCRKNSFTAITTKVKSSNKAMIALNRSFGFSLISTQLVDDQFEFTLRKSIHS